MRLVLVVVVLRVVVGAQIMPEQQRYYGGGWSDLGEGYIVQGRHAWTNKTDEDEQQDKNVVENEGEDAEHADVDD